MLKVGTIKQLALMVKETIHKLEEGGLSKEAQLMEGPTEFKHNI